MDYSMSVCTFVARMHCRGVLFDGAFEKSGRVGKELSRDLILLPESVLLIFRPRSSKPNGLLVWILIFQIVTAGYYMSLGISYSCQYVVTIRCCAQGLNGFGPHIDNLPLNVIPFGFHDALLIDY
jgi:hypothetical protein